MKTHFLLVLALLAISISSCVHYVNPIDSNPIGRKYTNSINIRNMELPLPEGEWEVIGRGYADNHNFIEIILEKDIDNKPHSAIYIARDSGSNIFNGYLPSKYLERTNIHHVVSNNNERGGAQDGWCINHFRLSFSENSSKANKEAYKHIIDKKLVMPGNVILVRHRFTGAYIKQKFLLYSLYLNPEAEGFDPPRSCEWASSEWNPLKINSDPRKVAYIEKLKEEGVTFHEKLKQAFFS